jgi:hypothetical protein
MLMGSDNRRYTDTQFTSPQRLDSQRIDSSSIVAAWHFLMNLVQLIVAAVRSLRRQSPCGVVVHRGRGVAAARRLRLGAAGPTALGWELADWKSRLVPYQGKAVGSGVAVGRCAGFDTKLKRLKTKEAVILVRCGIVWFGE